MYYISLFCADCKVIFVTFDPYPLAFLSMIWHSLSGHLHRLAHVAHLFIP